MNAGSDRIESFYRLLKFGFDSGDTAVAGVCQFLVSGADAPNFYVEVARDSISYGLGMHRAPTTTIAMPATLFASIVDRPDRWDFRNREVLTSVTISGDVGLALFLGNIAKVPTRAGTELFEAAEHKARGRRLSAGDIATLTEPTQQDVIRRLDSGIPFVIADYLSRFDAWAWPFEKIRNTFGDLKLDAFDEQTGALATLRSLFDAVDSGRESYLHGIPVPAAMRPFFRIPLFPEEAFSSPPTLWMGRRSGASGDEPCTSLHRDTSHGFLAQIRGSKKVVLCSPDQAEKVYPERAYNLFQPCRIKIWRPDYERFPLSRDLHIVELTLRPAQLLVIPVGWFHEMYCAEPVMSLSTFMEWNYLKGLSSPAATG